MRTDKRVVASVEAARVKPGPLLATGALILGLAALAFPVRAETVITSHGISTFGDLKLPADFPHLPYVNPDAPKGGEISQWAPGSFNSFNPYAIAGNPAARSTIFYKSILSGTLDDVSAAYCLMCETMEYPEDRSWVIFNLRKDVKFSDGSPITAEDVVFSYELFRDKGIAEYRGVANEKFQTVKVLNPSGQVHLHPRHPFSRHARPRRRDDDLLEGRLRSKQARPGEVQPDAVPWHLAYVLESFNPGQQIIYKRDEDSGAKTTP